MIVSFLWIIVGIVYVCYKLVAESKHGESIIETFKLIIMTICLVLLHIIGTAMLIICFTAPPEDIATPVGWVIICAIWCVPWDCMIISDIRTGMKIKKIRKAEEQARIDYENKYTPEERRNFERDYIVNALSKIGKKTTYENTSRFIEDSEFKTIKSINNPFYLYCWMCKKRTDDIRALGEEEVCKILGVEEKIRCLENYTHVILSEFEGLELFIGELERPLFVGKTTSNDYLSLQRYKRRSINGGYDVVVECGNGKQAFLDDNTKKRIIEKYNEEKALHSYVSNIFSEAGYNISHDMILELCSFRVKEWQDITNENVHEFYRYLCKRPVLNEALKWLKISESDIPLDESLPEIIAIDKRKTLLLEFYLRKNGLELLENEQGFVNVEDEYYQKVNDILNKKYSECQLICSYTPIDKSAINWATLSKETDTELKTS